jgi:hypothetical protein
MKSCAVTVRLQILEILEQPLRSTKGVPNVAEYTKPHFEAFAHERFVYLLVRPLGTVITVTQNCDNSRQLS